MPSQASLVSEPTESDESHRQLMCDAPANARLLIHAAPGTGKTRMACQRAIRLAEQIDAHRLLFISFSRAAIGVTRQRSGASKALDGLTIRTLDSLAAYLHGERILREGDYIDSIRKAIDVKGLWQAKLASQFTHVFVDEAQDLVEERVELVKLILDAICKSGGGFTVLYDDAQSIHDFSRRRGSVRSLPAQILEQARDFKLKSLSLEQVYRVTSPEMKKLLEEVRGVLIEKQSLDSTATQLSKSIVPFVHDGYLDVSTLENVAGELWLFRKRAEILNMLSHVCRQGFRVRLRMGENIVGLRASIAMIVNTLPRHNPFRTAPLQKANEVIADILRSLGTTRHGNFDFTYLAHQLCRGMGADALNTDKDEDARFLTLSTIHAAKGMEAEHVRYFTPKPLDGKWHNFEECRIAHVALSRARTSLKVYDSARVPTQRLSARIHTKGRKNKRGRMSVGGQGDVDPFQYLGVLLGDSHQTQHQLEQHDGTPVGLIAAWDGWRYILYTDDDRHGVVGALSQSVSDDIMSWCGSSHEHRALAGLWWLGSMTSVHDPDLVTPQPLQMPFRRTYMWLAPMCMGLVSPCNIPESLKIHLTENTHEQLG